MTSTIQRAELQNKIWKIANEVRGASDDPSLINDDRFAPAGLLAKNKRDSKTQFLDASGEDKHALILMLLRQSCKDRIIKR